MSAERSHLNSPQPLAAFVHVGKALKQIRDNRWYRETHETFEAFCKSEWELQRAQIYRLIEASDVTENVSNWRQKCPILPATESQARPLTRLDDPKEQAEAVIKAYADGKIELPAMGAKVSNSNVSNAPSVLTCDAGRDDAPHPYTRLAVAEFLGWTRKDGDRVKPNYACTQAFAALELIERGLLASRVGRAGFWQAVSTSLCSPQGVEIGKGLLQNACKQQSIARIRLVCSTSGTTEGPTGRTTRPAAARLARLENGAIVLP